MNNTEKRWVLLSTTIDLFCTSKDYFVITIMNKSIEYEYLNHFSIVQDTK